MLYDFILDSLKEVAEYPFAPLTPFNKYLTTYHYLRKVHQVNENDLIAMYDLSWLALFEAELLKDEMITFKNGETE